MREADFTGARPRTATDEGADRCGVMRRAERTQAEIMRAHVE